MTAIEFTAEQAMLADTATEFCRNKSSIAAVRARIDHNAEHDPDLWQEISALGWLAIAVPEEFGGLGMGLGGVVPVVEAMGEHLLGSPYIACTLAIQALVTSASDEQKQAWLPGLAEGRIATVALTEADGSWLLDQTAAAGERSGDTITLSGTKQQVLDARVAEVMIVSVSLGSQPRLIVLQHDEIPAEAIRREVVIDETRRSYSVELDGIEVSADRLLPQANLAAIEQAALLLLSAEMSGGLTGVLNVIVEYLKTRKQFDRLIGSYQALKHPTVDILLAQEAAKSHVYHAATLLAQGEDAEIALRMAKAHGSEAFAYAGDRAVQFHGGFGFTYECDAQLFLRRALWCQHQFGDERYHRQLLAPLLLDEVG
jgi:alkylation response protein AidB-like acyl-CoA dehydrogenase